MVCDTLPSQDACICFSKKNMEKETVIEFYVVALHLKCFQENILRKTIVGYKNLFDYITFEKIISKQFIFVSVRTKLP